VIVNTKFWTGLAPELRAQLEKAMAEATDYTNSIATKDNEDALAELKKSGKSEIRTLNAAERKEWQTAMAPTWEWAEGRVGKEVLDLLKKAMAAA
jgi:C4-dicarboxylate-binding protein DctP